MGYALTHRLTTHLYSTNPCVILLQCYNVSYFRRSLKTTYCTITHVSDYNRHKSRDSSYQLRTRWKKGASSFVSWSTTFQEIFSTLSLVSDLSIKGLAFECRFLHSLEMSEQARSSMAFEVGAVHHCVHQSFEIAAFCQPFSDPFFKPMDFFWQSSSFPLRFVGDSSLPKRKTACLH